MTNQGPDYLYSIENAWGSRWNDRIEGSSGVNTLIGEDGEDEMLGGGARIWPSGTAMPAWRLSFALVAGLTAGRSDLTDPLWEGVRPHRQSRGDRVEMDLADNRIDLDGCLAG